MATDDCAGAVEEVKPESMFWPAQCNCGHIFLEKYLIPEAHRKPGGPRGFVWCGFCSTRRDVK